MALSTKERERKAILASVLEKKLNLREASTRLGISYRQMKRIYRRYCLEGDKGLVHKSYGKASARAYGAEFKETVLNLYRTHYEGFGPTLACEKLAKEGYKLSDETLRLWLIGEGLWDKKRKRKGYRKQRLRRSCFGELLQLDGSHHPWFGAEEETSCLMNLVDDATGTTLSLLAEQETTEAAMQLLKRWIECYGIPGELYVDLKTVYVSPKTKQDSAEDKALNPAFTHFSKACERLGIKIIKAYSPQAKGRVERNHAVYQDRFVKELKLQNIKTLTEANAVLANGFITELNDKFSKQAQSETNAHRDVKMYGDLNQIFCWEYTRQVQQDWTIRFLGLDYQIEETKPLLIKAKQSVTVRKHLDGTVTLWHADQRLPALQIQRLKPVKPSREKIGYSAKVRSENARKNRARTPWNLFNANWLSKTNNPHGLGIKKEN